jgi:hypothetical protein
MEENTSYAQMNKRRDRPQMAAAGLANDSPSVAGRNLAFPIALRAYFSGFRIDHPLSQRPMMLHLVLDQGLAFFLAIGLTDGSRYFRRFVIFKCKDKLPFRNDRGLRHTNPCRPLRRKIQDIVYIK